MIEVRSAKICRSGLKLETIMNSSGRPNTKAEHDPQDPGQDVAHQVLAFAGLVHDWRRVGDVAEVVVGNGVRLLAGGAGHQIGHQRASLSRVR